MDKHTVHSPKQYAVDTVDAVCGGHSTQWTHLIQLCLILTQPDSYGVLSYHLSSY